MLELLVVAGFKSKEMKGEIELLMLLIKELDEDNNVGVIEIVLKLPKGAF